MYVCIYVCVFRVCLFCKSAVYFYIHMFVLSLSLLLLFIMYVCMYVCVCMQQVRPIKRLSSYILGSKQRRSHWISHRSSRKGVYVCVCVCVCVKCVFVCENCSHVNVCVCVCVCVCV